MAESKTEASTSADLKQKTSLLDEDIGKEFFGSWKTMSVTENDAMDFNFETVPKGKKSAFNFDKLDMDFNLGGDFKKMSSFKMDMGDFDFSPPPKKNVKPKEKSEEDSSSGKCQGKQNRFAFSFDFDELDSFNFDSSLKEEGKKDKCSDSQKNTADISDGQASKTDVMESVKLTPSENTTTAKAKNRVCSFGDCEPMSGSPKKIAAYDKPVVPNEVRSTSLKTTTTRAEETDLQIRPSEETVFIEPPSQHIIKEAPDQSVSRKNSTRDTATELHEKDGILNTNFNTASGEETNVATEMILETVSNNENVEIKNLSPLLITEPQSTTSERNKLACNDHGPVARTSSSELTQGYSDLEDTSTTKVSGRRLHDEKSSSTENKKLPSKLPFNTLCSGAMAEKLTAIKEKDTSVIRSRFFKRLEETESRPQQISSTETKNTSSENKLICGPHLSHVEKRREHFDANRVQIGSNVISDSSSHAEKSTTDGPSLSGRGNTAANSNNISLQDNPSSSIEQGTKSSTQKSVIPNLVVPSMASMRKIISVGRNKLPTLKAVRSPPTPMPMPMPSLTSLNISGSIVARNGPPKSTFTKDNSSNSTSTKELKSLRTSEHNIVAKDDTVSKISHSINTEKEAPISPSLKRKTCEESNSDLVKSNPLKRLSASPGESRVKEALERVQEQACNHNNQVNLNFKNSFGNPLTSALDIPREVNMAELEIPLVLESDENVEKAEAYTKELEDICNMLRKKHEETKELLVRAVVNNNNLLMLNHPIYEEKIRTVQKFAERLLAKEIQA